MRRSLLILSLLTAAASPLMAHASDIITINLPAGTYTLTVPSGVVTPSSFDATAGFFTLTGVAETGPGGTTSIDTVEFWNSANDGGLEDMAFGSPLNFLDFSNNAMFSGTLASPTFLLGNFMGTKDMGRTSFTYSIAASPTVSATPEPSSLLLLGTGALGVAGSLRRRIFA